jgi:hypothetical protein
MEQRSGGSTPTVSTTSGTDTRRSGGGDPIGAASVAKRSMSRRCADRGELDSQQVGTGDRNGERSPIKTECIGGLRPQLDIIAVPMTERFWLVAGAGFEPATSGL